MVKTKAKAFALRKLLEKQAKHSKMEKLRYSDLKLQDYLKDGKLKAEEMKTLFKYRTRMENFGENFRGGEEYKVCPLCKLHLDNQEMSLQCPEIIKHVNVKGNLSDIYKHKISYDIVRTLTEISEYRKKKSSRIIQE